MFLLRGDSLRVTVMLLILSMRELPLEGCDIGWFGPNCQFKCHCTTHTCNARGECYKCAPGYFGTSCQYVNLAFNTLLTTNPEYLVDENEYTCNPSRYATQVKVSLDDEVRFSFFRVHVNNENAMNDFKVKLNNKDTCFKERHFKLNSKSMDVTCDVRVLVKLLIIQGKIAPSVCSVYVSGGRNIALLQQVIQSSTLNDMRLDYGPENAIDGDSTTDETSGTCASTGYRTGISFWNMTIHKPARLYSAIVYTSQGSAALMMGFSLTTYDVNSNVIEKITDTDLVVKTMFKFVFNSLTLVKEVVITGSTSTSIIVLCEVELYGEIVCPDKMFSLLCNKPCKCEGHETCNVVNGLCAAGCPTGYYGFQCNSTCERRCDKDSCLQTTGQCYKCPAGFMGDKCDEECRAGTYGKSCEEMCSPFCIEKCDTFDGVCKCRPGYKQPNCKACPKGTFGVNCVNNCSVHCVDNDCNSITGKCVACYPPRTGMTCEECPKGFYGTNCTRSCAFFCADKICDSTSGECVACESSHIGRTCQECPSNYYGLYCSQPCPVQCENMICNSITGLCELCSEGYQGQLCSAGSWEEKSLVYVGPLLGIALGVSIYILCRKTNEKKKLEGE